MRVSDPWRARVMGTGNHYLFDVLAGVAVLGAVAAVVVLRRRVPVADRLQPVDGQLSERGRSPHDLITASTASADR